tara:strand:- start:604 stop:1485 length:882 start_codon:yes stop_codon:yes gene_type:complete
MNPQYKNIVVGSSVDALLFAFKNNYPVIFTTANRPFRFDYLCPEVQLSCLKIPFGEKSLTTFANEKKVGIPKQLLWERILFLLSLDGLVPLSNLCHTLRCDGSKIICSTEYNKIAEIKFDTCHYFGDDNGYGFVEQKSLATDEYLCYDWIAFNRGGKHPIDYFKTSDNMVHEIWFYPSDRIDGDTPVKDACVVSVLTEPQLLDFDYSETMVRFKLIHEMESRGMKGLFNGYSTSGKPKYYKFRTTSISRARDRRADSFTAQASNIEIQHPSQENLLKDLSTACLDYDRFLSYL